MFDSILGRLTLAEPTRAVVEVGGLGYEVHVPLSTFEALPAPDHEVRLLLHPVVRENEWRLFGFSTVGERNVFRALLRVSGVGPVLALGLLSGLTPAEFAAAVSEGDVAALVRVKGIGRKTAERIVVELRDVVAKDGGPPEPGARPTTALEEDAVRALVALGLEVREARRRIETLRGDGTPPSLSDLVRAALRG